MLTKTKNIRKKFHFFFLFKNERNDWAYGQGEVTTKILKEIHAITSEIIDATDGRTDERTNFDFMSSADIVKQS